MVHNTMNSMGNSYYVSRSFRLVGIDMYKELKEVAGTDYTDYDSKGDGLKYRVIRSWFKPYMSDELN